MSENLPQIMKRTLGACAAACATILIATASSNAQTVEELKAKNKLTVGVVADLAPFGTLNAQQQHEGIDIDAANIVGQCLGLPVEFVTVTGANRIPFLLTGNVDLLAAALGITPERAQQVQFSRPYVAVDNAVIAALDSEMASITDLTGKRIGVPRGSSQEAALVRDAPEGTEILRFDDQASSVQALLSGQVDATAAPETVLNAINQVAPDRFAKKFSLFVQKNGMAVRPGQTEFVAAVDACLDESYAKGELGTLYRNWFGTELPQL